MFRAITSLPVEQLFTYVVTASLSRVVVNTLAPLHQVPPTGPDWCCPSDVSPQSPPGLSPRAQLWDFQRKPRALYERSSGDSNVSTTSALELDAFIGGGMAPMNSAGAIGYGSVDTGHHMAQWGAPLRGGDVHGGVSQMLGHPGPSVYDSQWQTTDMGGFLSRPSSAGRPLDERRAMAWHDLRANFVP